MMPKCPPPRVRSQADSTNIQSAGAAADALQLRPFEVVGEEWQKLRQQNNISTPQITIWQNLQNADGNLYKEYLKIYRDPAYADLIYRDPHTGKQVFFATANPLPAQVAEIEARAKTPLRNQESARGH